MDKSGLPEVPPPPAERVSLEWVERGACLLALAMVLVTLPFGAPRVTAGVAVGALLALLNYYLLKRFASGILGRGEKPGKLSALMYFGKYVITGAVVFVAVRFDIIDVFGLLAGLMVFIIAVTVEGWRTLSRQTREEKRHGDAPHV